VGVTKTLIEMGLNLKDLPPMPDMFHGIILGQSSTPIGRIVLEVYCGTRDNKRREMLTIKVPSFDIGYNSILERPFLLKFMAVIHTTYATMKMLGPNGMITIKADQRDTLTSENATLTHVGCFNEKAVQEQAAKVVNTQGSSTPLRSSVPKPLTISTPQPPLAKKGTYAAASSSTQSH
jgi:hypothetical protein